jgi:hypothetical protein
MGLKLVINISKKIPGPTDYSSVQAGCSVEGELVVGQDAGIECARLYAQAEAAVDRQLGLAAAQPVAPPVPAPPAPVATSSQPSSSRPASYPSSGGRRAPSPISAAQLRFLRQLLDRTPGAIDRILAEHRVASIEALSSRAASSVIDQLKTAAP